MADSAKNNGADAKAYSSIDIAWNALNCKVASKADGKVLNILTDVSGYARAGKVTSIMGPSGAGKTTTMDLLAGRLRNASKMTITGEVLVNDEPVDYARFRNSSAYVQQQDDLPPTETVRECLMFSAQLRLPGRLTHKDRQERVESIINELSLQSCADTLVGSATAGIKGISGGEKRRTSVGMELVTSPKCVFLDEPTSGLDSEIAVTIMRTLRDMAASGRTVALTIHQPNSDITEMFDDFILMGKGRIMYAGPYSESIAAFAGAGYQCPQYKNPTDYYMKVACEPEGIDTLVATQQQRWMSTKRAAFSAPMPAASDRHDGMTDVHVDKPAQMQKGDLAIMDSPEAAPTSFVKQLMVLCKRQLRAWRRHPMMLMGEGVQYVFFALFIGGMYFDVSSDATKGTFDRAASGFFYLVCIAFVPPFTIITVWQDDRKLIRKEVNQHVYSLDVAFWAKTIVTLPIEMLFSLFGSVIAYFMFGYQKNFGKFLIFWLAVALTLLTSESLGMLLAMITPSGDIAIVLASIVFILLLSLTGFLTLDTPDYYSWIEKINFVRYGNSLVFINEMKGLKLVETNPATGERILRDGDELLLSNNLDNGLSVAENIAVLVSVLVGLRLLAWVGLRLAHRRGWL